MNKNELYEKYKFLIFNVMKDVNCFHRTDDEWQEYYDAGEMGLLNAIKQFDPNREEKISFFYKCIKTSILREFYLRKRNSRYINYLEKDSLDEEILDNKQLESLLADDNINIEEDFIKKEQNEILYKAIDMLKPTYKDIICRYYGINCKKEKLEKMAKSYGISRQALSVKKDNALKKLKKNIEKMGGIYFE